MAIIPCFEFLILFIFMSLPDGLYFFLRSFFCLIVALRLRRIQAETARYVPAFFLNVFLFIWLKYIHIRI